ncbi:FMN-binding negative transcriptional regulator [Flavobacterium stagni]|uniref:FMN-binding negative transcriptional regulator n=1 Tax=Flavobacterium stagni TaxID=2506421 RepID=A0A4Q1K8R3_9FLAO|nr:FMN-binding negative transcriptional regulator [Flavobacterium stagni]RXR22591.1 FMN-binding negative transcriptional regulator [Flavobacterium stagni]
MYILENYSLTNQAEIHEFLHKNGFALLINQTLGKLWATHVPLVLDFKSDGTPYLLGHISKVNPQHEGFAENNEILAVFTGPHAYISSSWYDHENVPTWNYIAVHVYGKIKIHSHEEAVLGLKKLVDKYEEKSENPIRVENLSEKTMREARGIIGFEIEITSIEAQKKLSQNRDDVNYKNIISELETLKDPQAKAMADAMKKNRP